MHNLDKTEIQLVQSIVADNYNKYSVLVDKYAPMIFHIVRRFIRDEDEVEEQAQQIFVKTYERLETFDGRSKFSTWLYIIGMNHCRDYAKNIRRHNKNFSDLQAFEIDEILSHTHSPADEAESNELNLILHNALQSITPDFAEAFLLKYRDGLSYKEMEELLEVNVNALKQRVHRARGELKDFINAHI